MYHLNTFKRRSFGNHFNEMFSTNQNIYQRNLIWWSCSSYHVQMPYPGHVTVPSLPILDVALELAGPLPGVLRPGLADGQSALVIIVVSLNSETQSGPLCHSSVSSLVVKLWTRIFGKLLFRLEDVLEDSQFFKSTLLLNIVPGSEKSMFWIDLQW